jgi:acetate kinase
MRILVLNCGSSSVKFAVLDADSGERLLHGSVDPLGSGAAPRLRWSGADAEQQAELDADDHASALCAVAERIEQQPELRASLRGIGHRVVHGGEAFRHSVRIDASVVERIETLAPLAPLHNPPNLIGIRTLGARLPELPQVAVFDTAFHQTLPPRAYLYAVPRSLYREHGVRRYGFHGSSHRYVAQEATRRLGLDPGHCDLITAHLGNGCSATAVHDGRSVDTTMGLSPLEGLVMGTRSGDVDPGLHEFLAQRLGLDVSGVTRLLNRESGLLGLSELSNDVRTLQDAAARGHEGASLALEVFCYRLARSLASLMVPLGRLDALVFTGGIGESAAGVRAATLSLLGHLGLRLDRERNDAHGARSGGVVTSDAPPVALVIPTDEERMIAADTAELLRPPGSAAARILSPRADPSTTRVTREGDAM